MPASKFDFKTTYSSFAARLKAEVPHDEMMSRGVGGEFENMGLILTDLTRFCGLQPDHFLIDVGCGSGRLAKPLSSFLRGAYLGIDVVEDFLSNARKLTGNAAGHWRFEKAEGLTIPAKSESADMVCFFSVITHLLHEESYLYFEEAFRVLKPGGRAVVSFLEFDIPSHFAVFEKMVSDRRASPNTDHLNMFVSRSALSLWAGRIGFTVDALWDGDKPFIPLSRPIVFDDGRIYEREGTPGQSVCLLSKPSI